MAATMAWWMVGGFGALVAGLVVLYRRRMAHIREAPLPPGILDTLRRSRPDIQPLHHARIVLALRDFYAVFLHARGRPVGMPSRAVDALWHEHILYTRHYRDFCRRAFGRFRFLHHTPAAALSRRYDDNVALRRTWWHACKLEGIDPRNPTRLPRLFALDAALGLEDGFRYTLGPGVPKPVGHAGGGCGGCGSHSARDFQDTRFDGTTDGFGDDGGSGGGDGCSSGCGGD